MRPTIRRPGIEHRVKYNLIDAALSIYLQGYLVFVILSQMLFFMNELSDVEMSASDTHNCQLKRIDPL